ncbi:MULTISPECIES: hypothetical protein [Spirulina sp. CCY15215]|uniref:hypothetical protein n=1 Tax=Spirulina sp. CCY15215 TaxID=2767591 RepID=UPI0019505157|nr:hypothetical protein [Spirulina major]
MTDPTIIISPKSQETLEKLSMSSGETIPTILEKAIENYRRQMFLMEANQAFTALRNDETLWQEELAERQIWDNAIADGLEE